MRAMHMHVDTGAAIVARWYERFNVRDVDGLCRIASCDIVISHPGATLPELPSTSFHGHPGLRTLMQWAFSTYAPTTVTMLETRRVAQWTLAHVTYRFADSSHSDDWQSHVLFEVEAERVCRIRVYGSEPEALAYAAADTLTVREREILTLAASGLNAREIADQLVISAATVHTHIRNAMRRLNAKTRTEAVALAAKRGAIRL